MHKKMLIGMCLTLVLSLAIGIFIYYPAEAGRVPLPGGWEVELVYCTDGFSATAFTPTDRDGPDSNRHTVILNSIDPAATNVGPIADFTWFDGFPTVTSYFRWDTPQTAGTPVNATLDRLQNGTSVTDAEGRVDTDVVQECQLPLLTDNQPGTPVVFGEPQLGELSDVQGLYYSFDGNAGDIVAFEALGVGGFSPTVTLISENAELLHSVNGNGSTNLNFSTTLPATGTYNVLIGEANGATGQFTLILSQGSAPAVVLADPSQTPGTVSASAPSMSYQFNTSSDGPTYVEVQSLTDGFAPEVIIAAQTGDVVASITNGRVSTVSFWLAAGGETFDLTVGIGGFLGDGAYLITIGEGGGVVSEPDTTDSGDTVDTTATEEPATDAACTITTTHDVVNVRSGGSTNHPVVGSITSADVVPATGFNAANQGWYEITLPDGTVGWISSTVVTATGDCASLPVKNFPAAPSAPAPTSPPAGGGTPEVSED